MKTPWIVVSMCLLVVAAICGSASAQNPASSPAADPSAPVATPAAASAPAPASSDFFKTDLDKISYGLGVQMATGMRSNGVELNLDLFVQGFKDVLEGKDPKLTPEEFGGVMQRFQEDMAKKREEKAKVNEVEGKKFLEENAKKEGIVVLPSGLQYKVLAEGNGPIPKATDKVKVNYRGTLIDGTEFDSTEGKSPAEFTAERVIKGWSEALQLMKAGSKWQLFIPGDLGYGPRGKGKIPPYSTLIFEVELLEVIPVAADKAEPVFIPTPSAPNTQAAPKTEKPS